MLFEIDQPKELPSQPQLATFHRVASRRLAVGNKPDNSLAAFDVTLDPVKCALAEQLIAHAYLGLAAPALNLSLEDSCRMVCRDEYRIAGRSRILAVFVCGPNDEPCELAGVVRVVLGGERLAEFIPPIDAMNFLVPVKEWPHVELGMTIEKTAELGRFAISEKFRSEAYRESGFHLAITRLLFDAAFATVAPVGVKIIYAIMPRYMAKLSINSGVALVECPTVLREDFEYATRIFEMFSTYWRRSSPRLYTLTAPNSEDHAHVQ